MCCKIHKTKQKISVVDFATNNQPDVIRADLKQHITFYFHIVLDLCQIAASFLLCTSESLPLSQQVSVAPVYVDSRS